MPAPRKRLAGPLGLGLVAGSLLLVPAPAHAASVDITLLNINDFHGRIDANTTKFATTVEKIRAEKGDGSTLLRATVTVPAYAKPSQKKVRVKYLGTGETLSVTDVLKFWVAKK